MIHEQQDCGDAVIKLAESQAYSATVEQLDRITQQNATLVEQAMAATESLSEKANHLASLVSRFRI